MDTPIVVAQVDSNGSKNPALVQTIKLEKPGNSQSLTVNLGYEQHYKLDLSSIANEKITLVHIGEKLIILFDNKSVVTVEPFFDSMNGPLTNIAVETDGRDLTSAEFTSTFPITTDQSVLTAAGDASGSPASGANFRNPSVDPLDVPNPLPLLGQEALPNIRFTEFQAFGGPGTNGGTPGAPGSPPDDNTPGQSPSAGRPGSLLVFENALAPNGSGVHLTPDAVATNVSITAGSDTLHVTLSTASLTSDLGLTWTIVGGQIQGFQNGIKIVTFDLTGPTTISPGTTATVTVTETLLAPLVHGADPIGSLGSVNVVAEDGNHPPVIVPVDAAIVDDAPTASPSLQTASTSLVGDTNLMLVLDISSSMNDASGLTGLSKLQVLKASVNELFEQYHDRGDVMVQIVTFSTAAEAASSAWMSLNDAKNYIDGLTASGSTNYDAAYTTAMSAFASPGKIAGAENVLYFLSDGEPTRPIGSEGLNGTEQATWTGFLDANEIDSIALGMGSSATAGPLNPLAYNGTTHTDTNAIVVTDLSQLTPTLVGVMTPGEITSNILNGIPPSTFGADGGHIFAIGLGAQTFTFNEAVDTMTASGVGSATFIFDAVTHVATITSVSAGKLAIDMDDGSYTYTAPASFVSGQTVQYGYTLIDGDGDLASSTITFTLTTSTLAPMVRDDQVITNVLGGPGTSITIPDIALLYNDNDPQGFAISLTGIGSSSGASAVNLVAGNVVFTDDAVSGGKFSYIGSTGVSLSDTGDVTVDRGQTGSTLTGTGLGEILIARNGGGTTINANEGNDVLVAGNGADTLVGGAGADLMIGGAGADIFVYKSASDSTITNHDTIVNFIHGQDEIDFTNIAGIGATPGSVQGSISAGTLINVHSIAWVESGGNTYVYVNTTNSAEAQSIAQMQIVLSGTSLGLAAVDFHHV